MGLVKTCAAQVNFTGRVYQVLLNRQLKAMGGECTVSHTWVKRLMHEMGHSYKAHIRTTAPLLTEETIVQAEDEIALKITYMVEKYSIPYTRVINIDETSVQMLPGYGRGWSVTAAPNKPFGDPMTNITVTLAVTMHNPRIWTQLIFKGKTTRSLPSCPHGSTTLLSHTHNHWCTVGSLKEFVSFLDGHLAEDGVEGTPWLLVLDLCPVHISKEFRKWVFEEKAHIKLVFIAGGKTCVAQPLDIAFMRPFKCNVRNEALSFCVQM